jgi:hypothetical protein
MYSPNYEPIAFSDADRYETWYGAMHDEIYALCSNDTWSLVSFHLSMNVVDSQRVYKIKHLMDGRVERYKVRLVASGFT